MSATIPDATSAKTAKQAIDRTVADLKNGVTAATGSYGAIADKAAATGGELVEFQRGTLQAMTEAGQILMAGYQDLFHQMATAGQTAISEGLNGFRAIAGAKTLREGMELQASMARTTAIWSVTEMARLTREGIDLAEKASAPLATRAYLAADKVGAFRA